MAPSVACWLACTVIGLALINLDAGPRLVSLPQQHGVSVIDAAGIVLLAVGWTRPVAVARRQGGYRLTATQRRWSAVTAAGSGAALLVVSLAVPDFTGRQYAVGAFLLLLECAAALAVLAHRRA